MNKKAIIFFILLIVGSNLFSYVGKNYAQADGTVVIPKEAIRLRILANSDSDTDQSLKRLVRDEVNKNINIWVKDAISIGEGREIIQQHIPALEKIVKQTLKEQHSNQTFKIELKKQVKFPTKMYGEFVYPAGDYEALLITIGKGEGANWWCVLFPPLCFLDFSNGDAIKKVQESSDSEDVSTNQEIDSSVDKQVASTPVTTEKLAKKDTKEKAKDKKSPEVIQPSSKSANKQQERLLNDTEDALASNNVVKEEELPKRNKVEVHFFLKDWFESLF